MELPKNYTKEFVSSSLISNRLLNLVRMLYISVLEPVLPFCIRHFDCSETLELLDHVVIDRWKYTQVDHGTYRV